MKHLLYALAASAVIFTGCQKENEVAPLTVTEQTVSNQIPAEVAKILDKQNAPALKNDSGPFSQSMSNLSEAVVGVSPAEESPYCRIASSEVVRNKAYYGGWSGNDCFLIMQNDGNLVLYSRDSRGRQTARWASNTSRNPGARCFMQGDGNLVIYNSAWKAIWCSGTWMPSAHWALYVTEQGISIRDKETINDPNSWVQKDDIISNRQIYWDRHYR